MILVSDESEMLYIRLFALLVVFLIHSSVSSRELRALDRLWISPIPCQKAFILHISGYVQLFLNFFARVNPQYFWRIFHF
jgi:hypothetical protein